jgi:hypothetical protein
MVEDEQSTDIQSESNDDPEWNELNQFTLSVMANRNLYDKYKKNVANTSDLLVEQLYKEKMYYKERIIAMTRDLFDEQCENNDINRAHEEYLKSCIEYLKWCDITEMVEEDQRSEVKEDIRMVRQELKQKIQESSASASASAAEAAALLQTENNVSEPAHTPAPPATLDTSITGRIMSFANKMCIRKKTMDDFIVMKPIPGNTDEEIIARLPKIRDYQHEIMKRTTTSSYLA